MIRTFLVTTAITAAAISNARAKDQEEKLIYLEGDSPKNNGLGISKNTHYSIGYLRLGSGELVGFDITRKGTTLDSTWGVTNLIEQAFSVNTLIEKNLFKSESRRVDGSLIFGFRHKTKHYPKSYISYQCYADQNPTASYGVNYGALIFYLRTRVARQSIHRRSKHIVFGFRS